MTSLYVVLLAGGIGTRLSPLSSADHPKQFLHLPGEAESLLAQTARAALDLTRPDCVITITYARFAQKVRAELEAVDAALTQHIILEPDGAGTAAASMIASLHAIGLDKDAVLWLLPCDHARQPDLQLYRLKSDVMDYAQEGHIVTFGVQPTHPDTGYGYLQTDGRTVQRFTEKPTLATAQAMLQANNVYWNSGMFAFQAKVFLNQIRALNPLLSETAGNAYEAASPATYGLQLHANYATLRPQAIDVAVMERSDNLKMLPLNNGWADIGTWPRLTAWWTNYAPHIDTWDFKTSQNFCLLELKDKYVA